MGIYGLVQFRIRPLYSAAIGLIAAHRAHTMLMHFDMTGVNHQPFQVRFVNHRFRQFGPDAFLRGRLKSWFLRHTAQHQPAHRNLHPGGAAFRQFRIVFAQTPLPPQPAQRPRHHPTPRQYRKTPLPRRARHYLQAAAQPFPHPLQQRAAIRAISPNQPPPRRLARQFPQYQPGTIAIRRIRRMHHCRQQQPRRIYHDMTLASERFLPAS